MGGSATFEVEERQSRPAMTSPRDFGTGAKWHVYMQSRQFLFFCFSPIIFFPHHPAPPSSRATSFFLDSTAGSDFYYSDLHRVLMDHTGMKTRTGLHTGLAYLHCEFFFSFPYSSASKTRSAPPT